MIRWELYNLALDRQEKNDLALQHKYRVNAMRTALEAWQKSVISSLNGADY